MTTNIKALCRLIAALFLLTGCASNHPQPQSNVVSANTDDKTIYGMICDGSNDTILVYLPLPYTGSDPDTLNILEASHNHQVFGQFRIGDQVAIYHDENDSVKTDIVIVTQDLRGHWCYKVLPTLRQRAEMRGQSLHHLPDSIKELLTVEREYGLLMKNDSMVFTTGGVRRSKTSDEESPVVYPEFRRYRSWYIYNGHLILAFTETDSLGNVETAYADTAQIMELTPDTLVLRFADHEQGYYRKSEE